MTPDVCGVQASAPSLAELPVMALTVPGPRSWRAHDVPVQQLARAAWPHTAASRSRLSGAQQMSSKFRLSRPTIQLACSRLQLPNSALGGVYALLQDAAAVSSGRCLYARLAHAGLPWSVALPLQGSFWTTKQVQQTAATPCPAWQQQCALGRAPACLQRLLVYVHRLRLTSLPDPSRVAACMRGLVEAARQPEE